jgi:hypothetical protein
MEIVIAETGQIIAGFICRYYIPFYHGLLDDVIL